MFFTFRVDKDITVSLINDKTKICILLLKNTKFSSRSGLNPKSFFFWGRDILVIGGQQKIFATVPPTILDPETRLCRCELFRINTSAVKVCDVYSGEEAEMFTIGLDKSGGSMWLLIVENKEEHDWLIDPPSWRKFMGFKIQFSNRFSATLV